VNTDEPVLKRLRFPLTRHNTDLLIVGDHFDEGGRFVLVELDNTRTKSWTWLDWDNAYDKLSDDWRSRFTRKAL